MTEQDEIFLLFYLLLKKKETLMSLQENKCVTEHHNRNYTKLN